MSVSSPFKMPSLQVAQAIQSPPQSTPSSFPFKIPSSQVGQAGQFAPPQSIPVSSPFKIPSVQVSQDPSSTLAPSLKLHAELSIQPKTSFVSVFIIQTTSLLPLKSPILQILKKTVSPAFYNPIIYTNRDSHYGTASNRVSSQRQFPLEFMQVLPLECLPYLVWTCVLAIFKVSEMGFKLSASFF